MSNPASRARERGVDVHLLDGLDVVLVHAAREDVQLEVRGDLRGPRGVARVSMHGACGPPYHSSMPGQRAVLVQPVAHGGQVAHVALVPDPRRDARGVVGLGVDRAVLGAARAPAALGLHAPVVGLHAGLLGAGADAVRDLVEAVLQRLRADLDRLEEDVVLGVTRHVSLPP